jgi:c-di-GMP-binding flagellar brake protein YcgR
VSNGKTIISRLKVTDISRGMVTVGVPIFQGEYVDIGPEAEVMFEFYSEQGVWSFKTQVVIDKVARPPVMRFKKPKDVTHRNKRHYPRIKLYYGQADFCVESAARASDVSKAKRMKAKAKDIAYDSACFISAVAVEVGAIIDLALMLPDDGGRSQRLITVKAEVVRVSKDAFSGEYDIGVSFVMLDTQDYDFLKLFIDEGGH